MANPDQNPALILIEVLNGDLFITSYGEVLAMETDFYNFRALFWHLFYTHNCFPFYKIGVGHDGNRKIAMILNLRNEVVCSTEFDGKVWVSIWFQPEIMGQFHMQDVD